MHEFFYPPLASKDRVGRRIALTREARGFNQKQFATALGIAPNRLSMWETGQRAPNFMELAKIAEATGASTDYLLLGRAATLPTDLFEAIQRATSSADAPVR